MKTRFRIGDRVHMTRDAIDNYGEGWRGVRLVVTAVSTRYMPAKEFFSRGRPAGYHPGFDASAGCALYTLRTEAGEALAFDLYDWELM